MVIGTVSVGAKQTVFWDVILGIGHIVDRATVIGSGGSELGTCAKLMAPPGKPAGLVNGPLIPGPLRKKAKMSLYWVLT